VNLPFSEDAEKALLSCALHGLEAAKPICARVGMDWFYIPAHQSVFAAIEELVESNTAVDWITVLNGLAGEIEEIGGKEYLSSLFGFVPSSDNWEYYAAVVLDNYDRRRLILNCREAIRVAEEETSEEAFNALTVKPTKKEESPDLVSGRELMLGINEYLQGIQDGKIKDAPMRWGIPSIEKICDGARDSELVLIGGESSHGKTALFCSIIALGIICGKTNNSNLLARNEQGAGGSPSFEYHLPNTTKKTYNGATE
jgi:replicative DNA helicase